MDKRLKTDLEVICEPTWVKMCCPHCDEEIEIDYDEFTRSMIGEYWCDWEGELITCEHCDEIFEIGCVHME